MHMHTYLCASKLEIKLGMKAITVGDVRSDQTEGNTLRPDLQLHHVEPGIPRGEQRQDTEKIERCRNEGLAIR